MEVVILMFRIAKFVLLPFGAVLLLAADQSWKTKDISQWNEQEARLLLSDSPGSRRPRLPLWLPKTRRHAGKADNGGAVRARASIRSARPVSLAAAPSNLESAARNSTRWMQWKSAGKALARSGPRN